MKKAITEVKSAQITTAVRNSVMNDHNILEGEIIGMVDGKIVAHNTDVLTVFDRLLKCVVTDDDSVISLYYGDNVTEEDANVLAELALETYDNCDVETYMGGQSVYDYIISVE